MQWIYPEQENLNSSIPARFRSNFILGKELAKRNLHIPSDYRPYLFPVEYNQTSPFVFNGMEKAVDRIIRAIKEEEIIGIWGDFDVDGQTSTALLIEGLSLMGARTIFHIPNRATESHGMQISAFKLFLKNKPDLIITCDTGVSDIKAVNFANSIDLDVIVTDHHKLPEILPPAFSLINPHQLPEGHPLSFLAGVGTAFQLIRALKEKYSANYELHYFYDLVALGTVADLAELRAENRYYTQMGLRYMNESLRPALKSLQSISEAKTSQITESTLGFNFAPRLNSSGRLGDANENIQFLLSQNANYCMDFAKQLEQLNHIRKMSVDTIFQSAEDMIKRDIASLRKPSIVIHKKGWQRGVLGIVAGKLAELYHRPVILFNDEGKIASGSARSIDGVDITSALTENSEFLIRYGGHKMAAGLSIPLEKLPVFTAGLNKSIQNQTLGKDFEEKLQIDHLVPLSLIGDALMEEIKLLAPYGKGSPAPVFASRNVEVTRIGQFGSGKNHTQLFVRDEEGDSFRFINWNSKMDSIPFERIDIAFFIQPDSFKNETGYYLEYIHHQDHQQNISQFETIALPYKYVDYRQNPDQIGLLKKTAKDLHNYQVWFEGTKKLDRLRIKNRNQLDLKEELIILSPPPSFSVLSEIINRSQPAIIYLFAFQQELETMKDFLTNLGGLLKYYINQKDNMIDLSTIAAQLCQTKDVVSLGISWFHARGDINVQEAGSGCLIITDTGESSDGEIHSIENDLNKSLNETTAFRKYYLRADPQQLLRKF